LLARIQEIKDKAGGHRYEHPDGPAKTLVFTSRSYRHPTAPPPHWAILPSRLRPQNRRSQLKRQLQRSHVETQQNRKKIVRQTARMELEEFARRVSKSEALVFVTGAGISTGNPACLTSQPRRCLVENFSLVRSKIFSPAKPRGCQHWQLKKATYELFKTCQAPTSATKAICDFEQRGQLLGLITQNIDACTSSPAQSRRAWSSCMARTVSSPASVAPNFSTSDVYGKWHEELPTPTCDACGGSSQIRQCLLWPIDAVEAMQRAQRWSERADIFVVIGSSLQVQPAASFPVTPNAAARSSPSSTATRRRSTISRLPS